MILLLLIAFAHAGELQITTPSPVLVFIDGRPGNYVIGTNRIEALNLSPGSHEVLVRTMLGRKVTSLVVDVPADMRVQLDYDQRALVEVARTSMTGRQARFDPDAGPRAGELPPLQDLPDDLAPAATATGPEVIFVEGDGVERPPPVGSLSVEGMGAPSAQVWVDGVALEYASAAEAWIATSLSDGSHKVRVEINGKVRYDGALPVVVGQNTRCLGTLTTQAWKMDCATRPPELSDEDRDQPLTSYE